MKNTEALRKKIEEYIGKNLPEYFVMDWKFLPASETIELYLDSRKGITVSECGEVAKKLSEVFPELGEYMFVVSSPGLDKPLRLAFQFEKNLNKMVSVYNRGTGEEFFGKLVEVCFPSIKVLKYKQHKKQIRPTKETILLELNDDLIVKVKI